MYITCRLWLAVYQTSKQITWKKYRQSVSGEYTHDCLFQLGQTTPTFVRSSTLAPERSRPISLGNSFLYDCSISAVCGSPLRFFAENCNTIIRVLFLTTLLHFLSSYLQRVLFSDACLVHFNVNYDARARFYMRHGERVIYYHYRRRRRQW